MTDVQAADAAGEVDERVAVDVRDRCSARVGGDDRERERERLRDHTVEPIHDLARARARDVGGKPDRACRSHAVRLTEPSARPLKSRKRYLGPKVRTTERGTAVHSLRARRPTMLTALA